MSDRARHVDPAISPLRILVPVYLLSGLCSLVYETAWIARFSLVFGSTVWGTSVVVAVFFGGLALGSRWFGHLSTRMRDPLRLYAILELAIGGWALAFPLLMQGAERVYVAVVAGGDPSPAGLLLLRGAVAGVLLLPPTVLMGGTLPVILRGVLSDRALTRRQVGLIYGVNAVGAAAGAALTGLFLLRWLGIDRTAALAALLNLGLGLLALRLRGTRPAATDAAGKARTSHPSRPERDTAVVVTLAVFTLSGFVSMSLEIVWLRHLTFFFRDTVHLYTGIITFFVLGIGCGSLAAGQRRGAIRQPLQVLGLLVAGIALGGTVVTWVPAFVAPTLAALGEAGPLRSWLVIGPLVLVPTLLMGASFPVVSQIVGPRARHAPASVGLAYALNTAGAIAGTLFAGFVLFPVLGLHRGMTVLFGLEMLGAFLLLAAAPARRLALAAALAGVGGMVALESGALPRLPHDLLRAHVGTGAEILEIREGATSTAAVVRDASGELQLIDGTVVIAREKSGFPVVQGVVPVLLADAVPERVLSLAFGAGLSTYGMHLLPEVETLDLVDISRENVALAVRHFPETREIAGDPRSRFVYDDAYNFLKYGRRFYDVVFVEPTPPMYSFRNAALYTREFYALARDRLEDGGIVAQVLPLAHLSEAEIATVLRTFASVHESCALWWNHTDAIMLGARDSLEPDAEAIARRLARPEIQDVLRRYSSVGFWRLESFLAGWLLDDAGFRAAGGSGPVYTDDRVALKYTTGADVSAAGIDRILSHAVEDVALAAVLDRAGARRLLPEVRRQRERLRALAYSPYPDRFLTAFREYMRHFPAGREADLRLLHRYLLENGLQAEARAVESELRRIGR